MKNASLFAWVPALALMVGTAPVLAQVNVPPVLPFGELSFIAPTGTASNTDAMDVWVRLTLDASSPPLNFSNAPLTGIDPLLFPTQGYYYPPNAPRELRTFAGVFAAQLNVYAGCNGSFIGDCTPGSSDYTFDFNYGANSAIGLQTVNVSPGGTLDFMLGTFTPKPGGAAPSTYTFSSVGLTLEFLGNDQQGDFLVSDGVNLAAQCPTCDFTRTITAVPEPESWALMLAGVAGLRLVLRRRGASAATARGAAH
jgi:hypothetical protein